MLNVLADTLPDKNRMPGTKAELDPVRYLLGVSVRHGAGTRTRKRSTSTSS